MHAVVGSRFRADRQASSFARVHEAEGAWCALVCNSYEFSFSAGWSPAGAELCQDAFAAAWKHGLDRALEATVAAFRAGARQLWTDDDWPDGAATASLIAVAREADTLRVRWIGEHAAWLVRDGAVIAATEPHTLARELAAHDVDPIGHSQAGILMRSLSLDPSHELEAVAWPCASGDLVIVGSGDVATTLRAAEIAALADAQQIADAVVERAYPFGVVAIAIRI